MVVVSLTISTVIDRVRTTGVFITKEQYLYIRDQMPEIAALQKHFISKGKIHYHPNKKNYTYALNFTLGKRQTMARFEVGSFVEKEGEIKKEDIKYYLSWTLWPHRLRNNELQPFHDALDVLLQGLDDGSGHIPIYTYLHTYLFASVKKLEIAADFPFLEPHTFIPWKARGFISSIWKHPKTGDKGTTYLGPEYGTKNGFAFYGKSRQRKETGQPPSIFADYPCTRFESRRYKTGLKLWELHTLKNTFLPLEIADLAIARALSDDVQWQQFLDLAMTDGSAVAISSTPIGTQRDKMFSMLRKSKHSYWTSTKIEQIWRSYLRAVDELHPCSLLVMSQPTASEEQPVSL